MLDLDNVETINSWLVKYLITIPFPYTEILQEQINSSIYANSIFPDYYSIHFQFIKRASPLPHWLDTMPLSWQILNDGAPLLFQLFIKEGYIEKLEVIDLALSCIRWEQVWTTTPLLDYEYDVQSIIDYLVDKEIVISKVLYVGACIDLALELGDKHFVASFRECQVHKLISDDFARRCLLTVKDSKRRNYRFTVFSSTGNVDFDCAFMFIQWHKTI